MTTCGGCRATLRPGQPGECCQTKSLHRMMSEREKTIGDLRGHVGSLKERHRLAERERDDLKRRLAEAEARELALRECVEMADTLVSVINTYAKDVTEEGRAANERLLAKFRAALSGPTSDAALREFGLRVARLLTGDTVAAESAVNEALRGAP